MKLVQLLTLIFSLNGISAAESLRGKLTQIVLTNSVPQQLSFDCVIDTEAGKLKNQIKIDTKSSFMTVQLDDGNRVRGFSSETYNPKTGITHYFIQGGSQPIFQRLTLSIKDNGKWARFTKAYNAGEIVCESN